jgi:hypothetical protein
MTMPLNEPWRMVCEERGAPVSHAAAILAPAEVDALMGVAHASGSPTAKAGRQRLMPGTSSLSVISYVIGKPLTLMGSGLSIGPVAWCTDLGLS